MRHKKLLSSQFGVIVRRQRNRLRISQEELAHRAGIDRVYVFRIEAGQANVSLNIAAKVARGLGKPLNLLIRECESK